MRLDDHPTVRRVREGPDNLSNAEATAYDQPIDYNPYLECKLGVAACPVGAIAPDGRFDFFAQAAAGFRPVFPMKAEFDFRPAMSARYSMRWGKTSLAGLVTVDFPPQGK
jgi:hypothetical protein